MNAPFVIFAKRAPIEEVFRARCDACAVLHFNGQISMHDAVDRLQAYAERSGLVDVIGQDAAQDILSAAFCAVDFRDDDEPEEFCDTSEIVRRWELADPRDRWQHTGEAPPSAHLRNSDIGARPAPAQRYRPPQATVDAFYFMARQGDAAALAAWLCDHPRDAPALLREQSC